MRLRVGALKLAGAALLATLAVAGATQAGTIHSQTNVAGHGRPNATMATQVQARLSTRSFRPFSLSTSSVLTSVVDGISGWPLTVSLEDDPAEWARTTVWVKKRIWVRRHGRRVRVTKRVRSFRVVYRQQAAPNPDYVLLVQAAQQFYASQPPPYNSGTCW
jgi:hypothetical protein